MRACFSHPSWQHSLASPHLTSHSPISPHLSYPIRQLFGDPKGEWLEGSLDSGGNSVYDVHMPPASAALLIISQKQ